MGSEIRGKFAEINIDSLKIALLHGEEVELLTSLINTGSYDVVIHGHTHEIRVEMKGKTLVINPGEVCGYLSERSTIAILDTTVKDARIITI